MCRIYLVILFYWLSVPAFSQIGSFPEITCGISPISLSSPIKVLVRPLHFIGWKRVKTELDNDTAAFEYNRYKTWQFVILERFEGFCPDTFALPVYNATDSLLATDKVLVEFMQLYNTQFAVLSSYKYFNLSPAIHIRNVHGNDNSLLGKVISIKAITKTFTLSELNIIVNLPDSANFGYDTATIFDRHNEILLQTNKGVQAIFTQNIKQNGYEVFLIGETYLLKTNKLKAESWLVAQNIYRKNYHLNAYFNEYEKLH